MTVGELIKRLQEFDQAATVVAYDGATDLGDLGEPDVSMHHDYERYPDVVVVSSDGMGVRP